MSGNACNTNNFTITKAYNSPRISSEFCDCSLPLTFDFYSESWNPIKNGEILKPSQGFRYYLY